MNLQNGYNFMSDGGMPPNNFQQFGQYGASTGGSQVQMLPNSDGTNKKKSSNRIKRPLNPFMVWSKIKRREESEKNPDKHNTTISVELGSIWRSLSKEEQAPFVAEAERLKVLHKQEHPDYQYRPQKRVKKNSDGTPQQSTQTQKTQRKRPNIDQTAMAHFQKMSSYMHPSAFDHAPSSSNSGFYSDLYKWQQQFNGGIGTQNQMTPIRMDMGMSSQMMTHNSGYGTGSHQFYFPILPPPADQNNFHHHHHHHLYPHHNPFGDHGIFKPKELQDDIRSLSTVSSGSTDSNASDRFTPMSTGIASMTPSTSQTAMTSSEINGSDDLSEITPTVNISQEFPWDVALKDINLETLKEGFEKENFPKIN